MCLWIHHVVRGLYKDQLHTGTSMDVNGADDDMPSPRTLRAAAERLAQYTSQEPDAGPSVQGQGFADIYSEVRDSPK